MKLYPRSAIAQLGVVVVMLVLVTMACSLSRGGDDKDSQPTAPATITPPLTRTAISTFTPFPSLTPFQGGQAFVTATRIVLNPTIPFYPTWTPNQATAYPYAVYISYPVDGSQVAGYVTIVGSASHPRFLQYALEWGPDPNPGNLWYPLTSPLRYPVLNGGLGAWDTRTVQDGLYQIRLHVWLQDGTETFDWAGALRVSNRQATAIPTLTPTPKPNRAPTIDPIPSQQVNSGQTVNIRVNTQDRDDDTVNLFVASSNSSIAVPQVSSRREITVTGVTAGSATITVTANDNRGGLANTAFIVTVTGQNRAPTLSPIPSQTVEVGQTRDVPVSASDPDNDPFTVTAETDNAGMATAAILNNTTVRLTGVAVGTANVTVTVNDGKGGVIKTTFQVVIGAPNMPPIVQPIAAQTMTVGQTLDVAYTVTDPDGDQLQQNVGSDTPGVVTASLPGSGTIRLVAVGAGTGTITLTVNDGHTAPVLSTFPVIVAAGNSAPVVQPIGPQTMTVGQALDVAYSASDPDGDPLSASASSDNGGVVTANVNTAGVITLNALSAGTATITLIVTDNKDPDVSTVFTVSVAAINLPPVVEAIFPQTLTVGQALDVPYAASDPEGDPLSASATSDNPGVVAAAINNAGIVSLNGAGAGNATVTITISDGKNPAINLPFSVTVNAANSNPAIQPISPQSVNVGASISVPVTVSDPESDPLTLSAASDTPGVATAVANGTAEVIVSGVTPGTATVSVGVDDGRGGTAATTFGVTVTGVNNLPVIQPLAAQSLRVGEEISVLVGISDPDGDPVVLTVISQNPGVATATSFGTDTITLQGVAEGVTNVQTTADDGRGGVQVASFDVTVSSPTPIFDLNTYPVIPEIPPAMAASLNQLYQSGMTNFGNQPGAFSKVGDDPMDSTNFLVPYATPGSYNLGNFGALQAIIDAYAGTSVRSAIDPAINSLNVDSVAAGGGFGIDTLSESAPGGAPCDAVSGTVLSCEFQVTKPTIALISFSAANVTYMDPDTFRAELQALVASSLSEYGVIPVLATIPAGNGVTTEQLAEYNRAIVEVATQSGVAGVPLWNLWRAMNERGIGDPNSVSPEGAASLTDASLSYGMNIRNLTALQVLQAVRAGAGIG